MKKNIFEVSKDEIKEDEKYYIFSKQHSVNSVVKVFWKQNDRGYTIDLTEAGIYLGKEILKNFEYYCNKDTIPVSLNDVRKGNFGGLPLVCIRN